ncbi:chemotaxis protein CheB [Paraburkholderia sp. LEh10]|uniref:chemotaxis protein CheB n=1 Tax=Paraburkholderia sp. LEh10 TaxID=2821353 RepID=UPI001AE883B9|nr:chemotaxis protein CheB [Paraburkholderia sp. LEh10]MBP0588383.1 chemotaxis protein CheB [Paraburkholderia sp. LEh10]
MEKKAEPSRIVVIGASLGGLAALRGVIAAFPPNLDAIVLIAMHIGANHSLLPELLAPHTSLPVEHARHDVVLRSSVILVAPPDRHLMVQDGRTRLSNGPKECFTRPAIDPLFRSAALEFGPRAIAVILTGDLDDGAAGAVAVRACGGAVIVQDPADSVAPSMPSSCLRAVPSAVIAQLDNIGETIVKTVAAPLKATTTEEDRSRLEIEARISLTGAASPDDLDFIGKRSTLTCPECGGVIWRVGTDAPLRYRCHTGHAFSNLGLRYAQECGLEESLWTSMRKAEECAVLAACQAEVAKAKGDEAGADAAEKQHVRHKLLEESLRRFLRENSKRWRTGATE